MTGSFGRRVNSGEALAPGPQTSLPIRASVIASGSASGVADDLANYVAYAIQTALYLPSELAPHVLRAFHVDQYRRIVPEGGHQTYLCAIRAALPVMESCQRGLDTMNAADAAAIHRRLMAYCRVEKFRVERMLKGGELAEAEPFLMSLDEEFEDADCAAPVAESLFRTITGLEELQIVSDDRYEAVLADLVRSNPRRQEREEKRQRQMREAQMHDPIWQALRYLCLMAKPARELIRPVAIHPGRADPDGDVPTRIAIDTDAGMCSAFVETERFLLFDDRNPTEAIADVPTCMVADHVYRMTGRTLADILP